MKNSRTSINRTITPQIAQWLYSTLQKSGVKNVEEAMADAVRDMPGLLRSELLLMPVNYYDSGDEQKQRFPQSEMLRRASLARKLHDAKEDEDLSLTVSEVALLKELLADYEDEWPFGGVPLDVVDLILEVNEMAGSPVALTE